MVALAEMTINTPVAMCPPSDRLRPNIPARITNRDRERIAQLYADGKSFAEVAEETGVARSTVMRIVRSKGIAVRPWGVKY